MPGRRGDRRFENMTVNQSNGSFFQVGNTDPRDTRRNFAKLKIALPLITGLIIDDPSRRTTAIDRF